MYCNKKPHFHHCDSHMDQVERLLGKLTQKKNQTMATSQHNNQGGDDKCVTSNISPNEQNVRQTHHCFLPDSPC